MGRSPIEMMVDQACGFDRAAWERQRSLDLIKLYCPVCKKEKLVDRVKDDPPGAVLKLKCPNCWNKE
jgi:hypothetical protein